LNELSVHIVGGSNRAIQLGLLALVMSVCQSCEQEPSVGYLARHSDDLMNLTVPVDASTVTQNGVQHTQWSDAMYWEFGSKQEPRQYEEWLTNNLRGKFNLVKSSSGSLAFAKNLATDIESIVVCPTPDDGNLHVRVDIKIVAD